MIVENSITEQADFTYWRESDQARQFRETLTPAVMHIDYRLPYLENATRNHGITLGTVAARKTDAPELRKPSIVCAPRATGAACLLNSTECRSCFRHELQAKTREHR
jgi:hypothetical protein